MQARALEKQAHEFVTDSTPCDEQEARIIEEAMRIAGAC